MILIENIYILFGSEKPISTQLLKKRYYQYSKLIHPDVIKKNDNSRFFTTLYQKLSQAYNLLVNRDFKQVYDRILQEQLDNVEILNLTDKRFIDIIDCDFTTNKDKLKLAQLDLYNDFKSSKYKLLLFYFLNITPDLSLKLLQSISQNVKNIFFDFYFDLGYEILLHYESYFEKYVHLLAKIEMNDFQQKIITACINYLNDSENIILDKNLLLNNNLKLLYLLEIKNLEKVTKANTQS